MYKWLYLLLFSRRTVASPVSSQAMPSGSACLAVLVTLFLLLLFLLVVKRLFIKKRQLEYYRSSGSETSFVGDSFAHSSASILPLSFRIDSRNNNTGVLVGLLGSPAWETSVKLVMDPSMWTQYKRYSVVYQHTHRHRAKHPHTQASDVSKTKPTFDQLRSISVATFCEHYTSFNIKPHSLRLPSCPSKAYADTAVPRRLSLPSLSRQGTHDALHLKRFLSLKCPRTRRSDILASSNPSNHSLRLVEDTTGPEHPLPFSPTDSRVPFSRSQPTTTYSTGDSNRDLRTLPPSLISTSSGRPFSSPTPASDCHQRNSAAVHISYPSNLGRIPSDISPIVDRTVPCSPANSKVDCHIPIFRKSLAPVTTSINFSSPVLPALLPLNSAHPTKMKQKPRSPSVRVRRSPPIGPSPLRTMILPDNSDVSPSFQKNDINSKKDTSISRRAYHSHLGLGFPTNKVLHADQEQPNITLEASQSHQHPTINPNDDGPNILLSIIRELVEETSKWDASLFVDDNFKSMIQNSGLLLSERTEDNSDTENGNSEGNGMPPDRSEELDLGLIGTDVVRQTSASYCDLAGRETSGSDVMELASFWDEGSWGNDEGNSL